MDAVFKTRKKKNIDDWEKSMKKKTEKKIKS